MGGVVPSSSARDFESLDFVLPTQLNSSNKSSVIFVSPSLEQILSYVSSALIPHFVGGKP